MELGVGGSSPPSCTKKMSKQKRLKPELASGFRDRKGNELILKDRLIEIIKRNFQLFGFEPLETSVIEYSEMIGSFLPDQDRPNEGVFSFEDDDGNWLSLRYDLTAGLARYVSENFDLPQQIVTSDAERALTTAKYFKGAFQISEKDFKITHELYDFSGHRVMETIKGLDDSLDIVMIVGHNHAFTSIANMLGNKYMILFIMSLIWILCKSSVE